MKKRTVLLLAVAALCSALQLNAQTIKLGIQGLVFKEDTLVKETVQAHSVISVQNNYNGEGNTAITIGGTKRASIKTFELGWNIIDNKYPDEWFGIDSWKSVQVTVNPFIFSATNRKGTFGLSMALGIRANNYRFDAPYTIEKVDGKVHQVHIDAKIKKSKFTTAAIHIPMELTVGKPSRLALSLGGFADLNFNSHTKIKYSGGSKDKLRNFPVNFVQAGFSARISCKYLSLYCNYTPGGLFKDNKGPKMQVWSIGIGI